MNPNHYFHPPNKNNIVKIVLIVVIAVVLLIILLITLVANAIIKQKGGDKGNTTSNENVEKEKNKGNAVPDEKNIDQPESNENVENQNSEEEVKTKDNNKLISKLDDLTQV